MNAFADSRIPFTESAPEFKLPETGGTGKPAEINGPAYAPVMPEACETTPGCNGRRSVKLRLTSGTSVISLPSMTSPICEVTDSTCSASAATSTCSVFWPTWRIASTSKAALTVGLEARLFDFDGVSTERQGLEGVVSLAVRGLGNGDRGPYVRRGDLGARNGGAARIFYSSGDTGRNTGEQAAACQKNDREQQHKRTTAQLSSVHSSSRI